ncbi:uncharacterized protein EI97DRAFT_441234 [Westerdykella ornata]|uniref:Lysine-specific metallo-endopeptidase domain-containing protein n=1 Tax=Westerdykella ornata TaxID=318751 RepID=A0A6A6JSJ2_WESOR|nr:uncharacterized protein EI97DRAFT_441234 [Westerdykella ornata]KAF2277949.1 hypothetical protein EI97DRAFT_441234 [Westerdykella ornata]
MRKHGAHQVSDNLGARAAQYPQYGPGANRRGRVPAQKLIKLRCKTPESVQMDPRKDACNRNPTNKAAAYVLRANFTGTGPGIVFCPDFWNNNFPYLNDVTVNGMQGSKSIQQLPLLSRTKEHILLHEYFHVDEFGYWREESSIRELIIDRAYGAINAPRLAWQYMPKTINTDVLTNGMCKYSRVSPSGRPETPICSS